MSARSIPNKLFDATICENMKKIILTIALVVASAMATERAEAFNGPGNLGFVPFGFYQPYGIRYGNTVRTPPYFAVNPPVYYGTRYARPYGESPFASPPLLSATADYRVRPAAQFVQPPATIGSEVCNPYVEQTQANDPQTVGTVALAGGANGVFVEQPQATPGPIRSNPFVVVEELAKDSATAGVAR
jgi:hypothetical protein